MNEIPRLDEVRAGLLRAGDEVILKNQDGYDVRHKVLGASGPWNIGPHHPEGEWLLRMVPLSNSGVSRGGAGTYTLPTERMVRLHAFGRI